MPTKREDLIKLRKTGGNDSTLFLLDKLSDLEDELDLSKEKMTKLKQQLSDVHDLIKANPQSDAINEETKIEKTASKLAVKMAKLEKGDKGDEGDKGEDGKDGRDGVDGKDGKDADGNRIAKEVLSKIEVPEAPKVEDIINQLPSSGERFRDGLELLEGDKRTKMSAIQGLRTRLRELKESISAVRRSRAMGGTPHNLVQVEDLSSQLDGSTKTFNIPTARHIALVITSQFPFVLRPTIDFTLGRGQISFTSQLSAFETGQTCLVLYIK